MSDSQCRWCCTWAVFDVTASDRLCFKCMIAADKLNCVRFVAAVKTSRSWRGLVCWTTLTSCLRIGQRMRYDWSRPPMVLSQALTKPYKAAACCFVVLKSALTNSNWAVHGLGCAEWVTLCRCKAGCEGCEAACDSISVVLTQMVSSADCLSPNMDCMLIWCLCLDGSVPVTPALCVI